MNAPDDRRLPTPGAVQGLRLPPHNFEVEKALLGALMFNNKVYDKVVDILEPFYFADPVHTKVYTAISILIGGGRIANPLTLSQFFENDEQLSEIGGNQYLVELASSAVTIINAVEYGRIIQDLYQKREALFVAQTIVDNVYAAKVDKTAQEVIGDAEARLFELTDRGGVRQMMSREDAVRVTQDRIAWAYQSGGKIQGNATGLSDLDARLGGMPETGLVILAGRPSMGKSALVGAIADYNARAGKPVAVFQKEMDVPDVYLRLLSARENIFFNTLRRGLFADTEHAEMAINAANQFLNLPLFVDDTPGLNVQQIAARLRRYQRRNGIKIALIDHLGLIETPDRFGNKADALGSITKALKILAKELGITIILLCQLNRGVEAREDKRPGLADLRDSGRIEEDADQVIFIYREFYYLSRGEPTKRENESDQVFYDRCQHYDQRCSETQNLCELIIAKNRHGDIGSVKVFCDLRYQRFGDFNREGAYSDA